MSETQALLLDVKNLDEAGYIEGMAAAYGNVDYGNDRILPGAARKSLAGRSSIPMLLYHDQRRPVGKWGKLTDTDTGLLVEGKISTKTRDGGEAYELVKDGALSALSIGYNATKTRMAEKVRELVEVEVHEASLVTIGMNPLALIHGVKDTVKEVLRDGKLPTLPQFEDYLREAGFSKTQATAIAGKGLSYLLRSESGSATDDAAAFFAALGAHSPA